MKANIREVRIAMIDWFVDPGVYMLVDGQYGSTGKGLIAGVLAEAFYPEVEWAITNAGPNSGHTSYFNSNKIVLKQLPTFAVIANKIHKRQYRSRHGDYDEYSNPCGVYLCAGAIIDPVILNDEAREHQIFPVIHPTAAVIDRHMIMEDAVTVETIASTGQGTGPALQRKLRRNASGIWGAGKTGNWRAPIDLSSMCFFEVPQGYSLGINSGFYPHVTSRECTVSQALSDIGFAPSFHKKTIMSVRTYPIRVGNTKNSSGPYYPDQKETSWEKLGVEPEITTVTNRVRRVFTWSDQQFMDAVQANDPDVIFVNFMNYIPSALWDEFILQHVIKPYSRVWLRPPKTILIGTGPKSSDVKVWKL